MTASTPPGWPSDLPLAGPQFEDNVVGWLLDRLPPEYRLSPVRRHPLLLAMAARTQAEATLEATREVYRGARAGLRDRLEPAEIDTGLAALEALAATFKRTLREVGLVEEALQGHMWRPRL